MSELLGSQEIQQNLTKVPGWTLEDKKIWCLKRFENFIEAIKFVNKLVEPSEELAHHPDLEISYNKVRITLTSHDAGGLTTKDFELAQRISALE